MRVRFVLDLLQPVETIPRPAAHVGVGVWVLCLIFIKLRRMGQGALHTLHTSEKYGRHNQ